MKREGWDGSLSSSNFPPISNQTLLLILEFMMLLAF